MRTRFEMFWFVYLQAYTVHYQEGYSIGAFDDPKAQSVYIERYLRGKQSAARQEFLKRAWGWCRWRYSIFSNPVAKLILTTFLRYRNTAIVILMVLVNGPYSPHKVLDKICEEFHKFSAY